MSAEMTLPEGWMLTIFENVIKTASNGMGGKQSKDGNGIPVSRIETIADEKINFNRVGYISEFDDDKIEKYLLNHGDILFSHINSPTHLGKTAIFKHEKKLYHGINLLRIVLDNTLIKPEIFNYYCKYTRALGEFSLKAQHAVNQSSLNQKKLGLFEVPLPPLAEQHQIAQKLDELLAQVDTIKARLDAIPAILKRFRQSVLSAAVSGKLTEEWRQIVHGTKNDDSWSNKRVADIVDKVVVGFVGSVNQHFTDSTGIPFVSTTHITEDGFSWKEKRFVTSVFSDSTKKSLAKPDDILVARHGDSGRSCIVPPDFPAYQTSNVVLIKTNDLCNSKYLCIVLNALKWKLQDRQVGGVIKVINTKTVADFIIPFASLEEQNEIVLCVEKFLSFADQIEQRVNDAKSRVDKLTPSILAKAFRGELTADWRAEHPELISGENSAEALLAKIQAAKTALDAKKKRTKAS